MSKKNSIAAKAARREQKAASKQVNNCNNIKSEMMEREVPLQNTDVKKVGIVIDLIKKSKERVPVMFETDRNEIYEVINHIKGIKDLKVQQET